MAALALLRFMISRATERRFSLYCFDVTVGHRPEHLKFLMSGKRKLVHIEKWLPE